ncbi:UvrABC system protein C [Beauveria bassiana D1-5]|uniref:UvrABC system protein C n=1 Tax=Beauveria bassiana D1-5 TaxID=1245745 RepID=A0A0A2VCP0_BEABA|nr:UvrABC system protein C [Beauveria bassiana D1-5]
MVRVSNFMRGEIIWSDALFAESRELWDAARDHGLASGRTHCVMAPNRTAGFLSVSRSNVRTEILSEDELGLRLSYLAELSMATLNRLEDPSVEMLDMKLSKREREILQWTGEGIRRILEEIKGIKVSGEVNCGEDAIKWCRSNPVDVVLMDMNMPGIGGLEATRKIARYSSDIKVIMLTIHTENPLPAKVMQAGAAGYLSKGAAPQDVVNAIRSVNAGQRYIASDIAQQMALSQIAPEAESPFASLSERELQIMLMITKGQKVNEISEQLNLSPKTVNSYRYRMFSKLNISGDVELTHLAIRHGQPGVYRMYDAGGTVIYVGKAKDLKKRLSSYFRTNLASRKTEALVALIQHIDVTVTHTETEALLLEHNYIKLYQPRYNVLLRDDKSYPFIFLSADSHPRLAMHRGAKHAKGEYFGPFPNGYAVRETLALLQKVFPVRQCENSVYRNRSRPCLQYQIGRCLGPCVSGLVTEEDYARQVDYVRLFLAGKDDQVLTQLISRMEVASKNLEFEEAARIRDQIQAVRRITEKQFVSNSGDDLDVIGVSFDAGLACMHVLFIRQGKVLGSRSYFPKVPAGTELSEVVETFVGQFYLQGSQMRTLPSEILLDFALADKSLLADSLSELAGRKVNVQTKPRGDRARYLKLARTNAATALVTKLSQQSTIQQRLKALAEVLKLPEVKRMECFDISHTMGEQTVASCVVFDSNGPLRAEYRRYNITGITPGDDYAAMNQVLRRRYGKAIEESKIPDVILIDGGKGQLGQAKAVFAELDVPWDKHHPLLLGVAKGSDRKAGLETLFFEPEGEGFSLPPDSPALHVIQHIRDDSHDHAISGHRKKRAKVKSTSSLETIEGIGPKRRQMLLKYMGGLQPLINASIEEIAKVPGISQALAEKIYYSLKH